jgi:putative ABC transport system substrate-binding protein
LANERRRHVLVAASLAFLVPRAVVAQPSLRRVGIVGMLSASRVMGILDAFREGMRDLGHVEGKNLEIEYRQLSSETDPGPAAALVERKVDVIVAWATPPALTAQAATTTIPIVFVGVADAGAVGLVKSLARPGGNITGVTNFSANLVGKQLQLLREFFPEVQRVGVIANLRNPAVKIQLQETERVVKELGLRSRVREASTPQQFEEAFQRFKGNGIKAVVMLPDPSLVEHRIAVANAAIKARMATMFQRRENADAGGLISYGPDLTEQFRQIAGYVDRIFRGAKPADMPVQQPTKLSLVINGKTAKALEIAIPQSVLLRADKVID